ncbi:two-component system chemotaxis sensor kinase CheA [Paenibacillus sp. PvR052]|nr:chemotaxis protein CheA [Paenibacillus sp. PvP091]MBP1168901.1 two-component system chemotaxis sensor kinase CheA [Paenibacillus sp. PvR098]MBP2439929.1 two-component system chemotaxis sensor kinase CheA [Paenibacillus sp. PvP052]
MNPLYMSELKSVFLDEVEEQLQIMDQDVLHLEQAGESGETIQSLFRAAHTLKGSSAAMGFEEMKQLTHEMEHLLDQVRNRQVRVTGAMINLLFNCLDHLQILREEFIAGEAISTEISPLLEELRRAIKPKNQFRQDTVITNEQASSFQTRIGPDIVLKAVQLQEKGSRVFVVRVRLTVECVMKSVRAAVILQQLCSIGEVLYSDPSSENLREEDDSVYEQFLILLASQAEASKIQDVLLSFLDVAEAEASLYLAEMNESNPLEATVGIHMNSQKNDNMPAAGEGKRKPQTIRVDVERLEHLMNLVGELVIDQTRMSQVGNILNHRYTTDDTVAELGQVSDHVSRVIGELQESVMKVRMLPLEQLFNRFPRMVRDLAQSLNKEIELIIGGSETELDRTVIEEIGDPLIHLIRNAVDHGMETTAERIRVGKPSRGILRITAAHEENQVVITVEDDGPGIDPGRIRESAVRKGVVTEDEAQKLSDREAVYLIFRPGFSTAAAVSDISGRGVGMDIVRNHIEKLNGLIDIESKPGEGTRFKIKLPLTLAIITGLLIKLSGRTFILPMSCVIEIVRMPIEAFQTIKKDPVVVIREEVLPVVWLHDHFRIPRTQDERKQMPVVVVGTADKRIALVVDELNGNQEIVVKSLGAYVGKTGGVSGATILGDGRVALILEVSGICQFIGKGV